MKKTVRKLFWIWDFDKEEKWINDMSAKGMQLCGVGYCKYVFEEGMPDEYVYRMEMLDRMPGKAESRQYIKFIEDTGAECIGSLLRWVYFRKKSGEGGFDLFSDIASRIKHLNRILWLIGILFAINLFNATNQFFFWLREGWGPYLALLIVCLALEILLGYGFVHIYLKKLRLKRDRLLHE